MRRTMTSGARPDAVRSKRALERFAGRARAELHRRGTAVAPRQQLGKSDIFETEQAKVATLTLCIPVRNLVKLISVN